MSSASEDFRAYLTDYERLAPGTIANWVRHLETLLASVDDPDAAAQGVVSVEELNAWMWAAERRGLATGTRQNMWYGIRAFYRWREQEGYTGPTPLAHVRPPRARSAERRDYLPAEAEAVMAEAHRAAEVSGWRGLYDLALLATLRFTGARCSEVTDARLDGLDLARRQLSVLGKGSKRRTIPLPHACVTVLERYLADARPTLPATSALFPALRAGGRGTDNASLCGRTLLMTVKRFGEAAGVAGPHTVHRWRHTYATHLLRSGVDVAVVKELLGHTNIATTQIYLHLLRDDLRAGIDRAFG